MGLLERCEELFKTSNLYEVLGTNKEATEADIRRSYYKVSLKVHPDRAPEDPQATEKFQVLGKLYAVLSDKEQRAVYDEQGVVDEDSDILTQDRCWEDYWRLLFPKITVQDILEFEKNYKGSDEERKDLIQLYMQHEGDMDVITASALCCTQEDEPRLCSIIQAAIQSGEVKAFPAFTKESEKKKRARRKRADRERQEAEQMQKEMGLGNEDDSLVMMLKQKQKSREQNFNSFLSDLEAKYSKKSEKPQKAKRGKKQ
ncbi:dnaJ homolog subfamily C member 9 [Parambassis ranga]|uniref:DnaJ homolog subfamily C member 9 n=1 Tax=Parambassis ranga TaxID=210632 RepID=A0A6P7JR82_9TELE|nr:dnaJ homolog subfamily C member 9 [Parambassis ranga]